MSVSWEFALRASEGVQIQTLWFSFIHFWDIGNILSLSFARNAAEKC